VRGRRERRYLTEKYQNKQVRIAYATAYEKPYDPERYIRTEFARKRRFYDILCGNYIDGERAGIGEWGRQAHKFTREELGRLREQSFTNCGNARCPYCCNPRRGRYWGRKEITKLEVLAELHLKEELDEYYKEKYYEHCKRRSAE